MTLPGFTAEASVNRMTWDQRRARGSPGRRQGIIQVKSANPTSPVHAGQLFPASVISGKVYGNWCGEGYGSGVPVDPVDQVCCRHDKCYCARGDLDCSCDRELLARMPGAIAHPDTLPEGRAKGALIMEFFSKFDPVCWCHRIRVPRLGFPPWRWAEAPFRVPGDPHLKICPPPFG